MNHLFFRSNAETTDLKVAVPVCCIAAIAYCLALLGFVPEAVLQFQFVEVPLFRFLVLFLLSFGATLLLPVIGMIVPKMVSRIPKVILIAVTAVILYFQIVNIQNHLLVILLAAAAWVPVGDDRNFQNPHIIENVIVSAFRFLQTIAVLISSWILLSSFL